MNHYVQYSMKNDGDDSKQDQIIRFEQVKLQYKALPISLLSVCLLSALLAYIQWDVIEHATIIGWLSAIFSLTGYRYLKYWKFNRTTLTSKNVEPWHNNSFVTAALSGITWGSAGVLLFPVDNVVHQVVLAFVLAGMSAGALSTLTSIHRNISAFLLPILIPLIINFFLIQTDVGKMMGSMTTIFLIMLMVSARNSYCATLESIKLRFSHQQTKQALKESAEMNQQILDTAAEGIFGVDLDGNTTFVNPAAAR
ncbi:MAG: PAS domain-containing protein, partial [Gammaproteobacteria bacterium]|nr:PAS domain-containing protein [Gammaproteobacteria bacterium]